ncbi:hypothetical protein [Tolypothrix sp. VBCCA 56010]|uniref:hypothetical protein n=1 Tax=Tolypothrix sp. VBCCA 56010 TaxID=3137731 RepID=UPI003D7C5EBC
MKTLKAFTALTISALSALTILDALIPQVVQAQPDNSQLSKKGCDNRSLQGTYSAQSTGFVNNTDPLAVTGLLTFDGNGNVNGTILVRSIAGNVTTNIRTQGTYQVNSDCSLTQSFTRNDGTTANYSGAIFDDGNKYALSQTDPGTIVNVQAERVRRYQSR